MDTLFTPPAVVKQEPPTDEEEVRVKNEPLGPADTPWAMQAVTLPPKRTRPQVIVRIEPVHAPKQEAPWELPPAQEPPPRAPASPRPARKRKQREPTHPGPPREAQHAPPRWEDRPDHRKTEPRAKQEAPPTLGEGLSSASRVCARNYAAVEEGLERYGLIDMGTRSGGRDLLVHVRKRCRPPFQLLNQLRPGALLRARRLLGGKPGQLRVRYTTPARYYSPGALVTTLAIGVDEADWQSLMAGTRRI